MSRSFMLSDDVLGYVQRLGVREHPELQRCRQDTNAMGTRARMQISPEQGAFMQLMVRLMGAKTIVEVGTFTGYSALAMALVLKEIHDDKGQLYACDLSDKYLRQAQDYWQEAKVDHLISPRQGPAEETLPALQDDGLSGQVDLIFIDADKETYQTYYEHGLTLLRPGGLMMLDNMLWSGQVADETITDPETVALRTLAHHIHQDPRVHHTLASIGDGVSLVVKA